MLGSLEGSSRDGCEHATAARREVDVEQWGRMQSLGVFTPVESVLYGEDDLYHWDAARVCAFQVEAIADAFAFHFDHCAAFRRVCSSARVLPGSLQSSGDILRIPLIPSSAFKSLDIRTAGAEPVAKVCCSSGTRGSISRVPRDNTSLERFVGSIRISADQLLDLHADARIFNLGPDTDEAADTWFPYVMSLLGMLRPADNYVLDGVFYVRSLLEDVRALTPNTQPVLVGPPIFFVHLMQFLDDEHVALDLGLRDGFIVTAGGWKNFASEQIERTEFVSRCETRFGVRHDQLRDAYNMVELNTVIFECELGAKHIPPWLVVEALDPEKLTPVPSDEMGLLAFFDPLPTGYPGFILSDDFGRIGRETCSCGRSGPTLEFCRRVALPEGRGCALVMDRSTRVRPDARRPRYGDGKR
jgi:long-chain-fatty-acid---luciferin-component ligase